MTENPFNGLTALAALREKLDGASSLDVIHEGGYRWKAHFTFYDPARPESLEVLKSQLPMPLPFNYQQFLLHYDGALLYKDDHYGQWGFRLYGTTELISANEDFKKRYEDNWPSSFLVFAKSLGDTDRLILDTAQPVDHGKDCRVIDGDTDDPPSKWEAAAPGFGKWLDRLIVAQGAKYWRWYR